LADSTRDASALVRENIERDGIVRQGLARGLINARALARTIQLANPRGASFDAILSAIRRYPITDIATKRRAIGKMILKLSMKNNVSVLSMRNLPDVQMAIARFAGETDYAHGQTFRVISGTEMISVTVDSKNVSKLESKISREYVRRQLDELAELVVDMVPDIEGTSGVLSAVTTELTINDVNVVQLSTVGPGRITILVKGRDATKAYLALEGLSKAK